MQLTVASARQSAGTDQDRLGAFDLRSGKLLVVADGAGGMAGGCVAAQRVVKFFAQRLPELIPARDPSTWSIALADLDAVTRDEPNAGETTAVVACCIDGQIVGASVGDSCAWMIHADGVCDLTHKQRRKPLLGSGVAIPVPFGPTRLRGRLLLASDGLFKYASSDALAEVAATGAVGAAAASLIEAVRLPNGGLQDDVAVVLCEMYGVTRCTESGPNWLDSPPISPLWNRANSELMYGVRTELAR